MTGAASQLGTTDAPWCPCPPAPWPPSRFPHLDRQEVNEVTHGGQEATAGREDGMDDAPRDRPVGQQHLQLPAGDVLGHDVVRQPNDAGEQRRVRTLYPGTAASKTPSAPRSR